MNDSKRGPNTTLALVLAIVATVMGVRLVFGSVLGIVAIVLAVQAKSALTRNEASVAKTKNKRAIVLAIGSMAATLLVAFIYGVYLGASRTLRSPSQSSDAASVANPLVQ
jgi:uncharacterized membrane protein